jgi:hypothetical protein
MGERQKSLFYKKIECKVCGANYKLVKEKNKQKYICSSYANYRTCLRQVIEEDLLIEMMKKRSKTINDVMKVTVDGSGNIEIIYNENNSQIISDNLIRF